MLTQQIKLADHSQCRRYVEWVLEKQTVDGNFSNKIFFNNHSVVSENPQVIEERSLHPEKATVYYALWSEIVIGPYFFENDDEITFTVNSERYGHMIIDFFAWY